MSVTFNELLTMLLAAPAVSPQLDRVAAQSGIAQEDLSNLMRLGRWQQQFPPQIKIPRLVVYAARHDADDKTYLEQQIQQLSAGQHVLNRLGELCNSDVRAYEMDLSQVMQNLTETQAAMTMTYGMMAVEDKTDLLIVSALSPTATDHVRNMSAGMEVCSREEILPYIAARCGVDVLAIVGACFAARMASVPVITSVELGQFLQRLMACLCECLPEETHILVPCGTATGFDPLIQALVYLQQLKLTASLYPPKTRLTTLSAAA